MQFGSLILGSLAFLTARGCEMKYVSVWLFIFTVTNKYNADVSNVLELQRQKKKTCYSLQCKFLSDLLWCRV